MEVFGIDSALKVDFSFQEYKRLVQETTIYVEQFWCHLLGFSFHMTEMIELGNKIVDNYMLIKHIYDSILKERPDYKELILLSIQFNSKVMNFESEALQMQGYLKNFEQKLKIQRKSFSIYSTNKDTGMMIVSQSPSKRNKIVMVNKFLQEATG